MTRQPAPWTSRPSSHRVAVHRDILLGAFTAAVLVLVASVTSAAKVITAPTFGLNLTVRAIEVTQSIQCLDDPLVCPDNSLPLVRNKPTAVRVFPRKTGGTSQVIDDIAILLRSRPCGSSDPWTPHPQVGGNAMQDGTFLREQRESADYSVDFLLAPDDASGCLDFEAEVNPLRWGGLGASRLRTHEENNYDDNVGSLSPVVFHSTSDLNIKFVRIDWCPGCPGDTSEREVADFTGIENSVERIHQLFPIEDVNHWRASKKVKITCRLGACDFTDVKTWARVLRKLDTLRVFTDDEAPKMHYFGLLHPDVPRGAGGLGRRGGKVAMAISGQPDTAAHELGHNLNRMHAPCGHLVYPDDVDPNWPDIYTEADIRQVGFDVANWSPIRHGSKDLMSYCGPAWISPYTYQAIYDWVKGGYSIVPDPDAPPVDHLVASGRVDEDGSVELDDFFVNLYPAGSQGAIGTGEYALVLLAEDGAVLFARSFDLDSHDGTFFEVLPMPEETTRIELVFGGDVLASRDVTPNAPGLTIDSPSAGDRHYADDALELSWHASDLDGDSLRFLVQISEDGGATWEALDSEIEEGFYRMDGDELPLGENVYFRVVATDGVNTTTGEVGPIAIEAGAAPLPAPEPPKPGRCGLVGLEVLLVGLLRKVVARACPR